MSRGTFNRPDAFHVAQLQHQSNAVSAHTGTILCTTDTMQISDFCNLRHLSMTNVPQYHCYDVTEILTDA